MTTGLFSSPVCLEHDWPGHPETRLRLDAIFDVLQATQILPRLKPLEAAPAGDEPILAVHSSRLLERLKGISRRGGGYLDADTYALSCSLEVVYQAVGGTLRAVDAVMQREVDNAFALLRPPGHHATRDLSMGFCLVNNVAIAAQYALSQYRLERVLVIDFDVHHGNGTQDLFYGTPEVLYFSTHRYPFYPGTGHWHELGEGKGEGYTVNVPLPQGVGNRMMAWVFNDLLYPVALRYRPQLVLVSAGYDAHWADPLGAQTLVSTTGYAYLASVIQSIARELCGGRAVYLLEGGYHLEALADSVAATLRVMLGDKEIIDPLGASPRLERNIHDVVEQLRGLHRLA